MKRWYESKSLFILFTKNHKKLNCKMVSSGSITAAILLLACIQMIRFNGSSWLQTDVLNSEHIQNYNDNDISTTRLSSSVSSSIHKATTTTTTTAAAAASSLYEERIVERDNNNNSNNIVDTKIQSILDQLVGEDSSIPYYIYDDPKIEQSSLIVKGLSMQQSRFWNYVVSEAQIISQLKFHKWRTKNVSEAKIFIIPFCTAAVIINKSETYSVRKSINEAFHTLYNTTTFQSTKGHNHLLFTLAIPSFATWRYLNSDRGLASEYTKLINVTIANDLDFEAVFQYQQTLKPKYQYLVNRIHPITRYSFSMNLQEYNDLPIIKASIQKFYNSSIHIFYHVRKHEFDHNNATNLRRAPLHATIPPVTTNNKKGYQKYNNNNTTTTGILSSIGYDIPKDVWIQRYTNSQFCLTSRGDTPHSRSFLRAVKVGCIPVFFVETPLFSPVFKHLIPIENYSIIINDEDKFIQNPTKELLKLRDIPEEVIITKLKWLALAQRLFFAHHPESLFYEALITEAKISSTIDLHLNNTTN